MDTARLDRILNSYAQSFREKTHYDENNDHDILMDVFSITPEMKRENRQYWGRELGYCWQLLVTNIMQKCDGFGPGIRIGADEPCDLIVGKYAIDTKYRIGSGDSGTLKEFKQYGPQLKAMGYEPVFLILREDNLPAAIGACLVGGWTVKIGRAALEFVSSQSGNDIEKYLTDRAGKFSFI